MQKNIDKTKPMKKIACYLFCLLLLSVSILSYAKNETVVGNDLSIDIPVVRVGTDYYHAQLTYVEPNWIVTSADPVAASDPAGIFDDNSLSVSCAVYLGSEYVVTMGLISDGSESLIFNLQTIDKNPGCSVEGISTPPNILLVIADDIGIEALTECYPNLISETMAKYSGDANVNSIAGKTASIPNTASRICSQGITFDNFWAQPTCSPTRATIMTGLYGYKNNLLEPVRMQSGSLASHQLTFPAYLKDNGYATAAFGKWHMGNETSGSTPIEVGFDYYRGNIEGTLGGSYDTYDSLVQGDIIDNPTQITYLDQPSRTITVNNPEGKVEVTTTYAPVVKIADAMDWIIDQEASNPDKPWFTWLAFNTPHTPIHTPNQVYLNQTTRDDLATCPSCEPTQFRAMINAMDTIMEPLLNLVGELAPNTIIIFIGDNGTVNGFIENLYLTTNGRGKATVYESGLRVPMAVMGPNVAAGGNSSEFVHTTDLFATIIDLAGLEVPTENFDKDDPTRSTVVPTDSVSIAPIIRGEVSTVKDQVNDYILSEIFIATKTNATAARNGTYKLVCQLGNCNSPEFFNLVNDPLEENPLDTSINCTTPSDTQQEAYCMLKDIILNKSHF